MTTTQPTTTGTEPEITLNNLNTNTLPTLNNAISILSNHCDGYGDRLEHITTLMRLARHHDIDPDGLKGHPEMSLLRYGCSPRQVRKDLRENYTDNDIETLELLIRAYAAHINSE